MFTFRAERHYPGPADQPVAGPTYSIYQADQYDVQPIEGSNQPVDHRGAAPVPASGTQVTMRRGSWPIYDDSSLSLFVGNKCPFQIVFVMNEAGKTIDTIR